jgi:ATP-dependent DNA helicase RecQ
MITRAANILKHTFGYKDFRPFQKDIIECTLSKRDALVIMPTGGGKSLCYQIPALIFDGLTVVISPLISLMKDQVEQLREFGIKAVFLNSSLSRQEYEYNLDLILQGKVKLLYIAPETLVLERTLNLLGAIKIDCITVDEAHCISEWGHDFRPEYRKIADIKTNFPKSVCVAFTATATPRVQTDIKKSLRLNDPKDFIASFNRNNLFLDIEPKTDGVEQTIKFLRRYPNQSGIIYCFSRKQVDSLYGTLYNAGFSVLPYHAGLADEERRLNQEKFIKDDVQIIVATIAFGMGINKSNVRFVIHYDLPKNIESYYQEIGRSGRDGLRAHCLLLFSYADIMKIRYFIDQKEDKERRIAIQHLNALLGYAETGLCRRIPLLNYFGENHNIATCDMCDNCNSKEKDLVDVTIPAQKFLSCIKRTGEMFGAAYIIEVLRGSKSSKVINNNHDKLSTYGIGLDYTKKQWMYLSHQFIHGGLIAVDEQYGGLKLTTKAYEVLKGNTPISARIVEDVERVQKVALAENYDSILFEVLRAKRKKLADRSHLPPYVIFSDKTLTELATYFPANKKEMIRIHGIGEVKFEKYGQIFLNEIIDYCLKNNIDTGGQNIVLQKKEVVEKKKQPSSGEKFNAGMSIHDLVIETKLKRSTILKHLLDYVSDNKLINPGRLLDESRLSVRERELVLNTFDKLGVNLLTPVYVSLKEKVSYDELHLLRIYYLATAGTNL